MSDMQTIELDCAPGPLRPWDLIVGVCEGTNLPVTNDPVPCFFGMAVWGFDIDRTVWEEQIQPVIKPRIEELYHKGVIRYGRW